MPFIELQSIDSTNNYARRLINEGLAQPGTAIFAREQSAGKGQRGKTWESQNESNIILSLLQSPAPLRPDELTTISFLTAVVVHEFFSALTGGDCFIKWPNDLYWHDRKAGGILIENVIRGDGATACWEWCIVGIGININQVSFPPTLPNPVSLKQITGRDHDPVTLARDLADSWFFNFQNLKKLGREHFLQHYNEHLYKKDQPAKFRSANRTFSAIVKRVTPAGLLVLQSGSIEEEYHFGDLEWIISTT